ncbi:hypothetical protein AWC31_23010 [Mycolicibacterium wolinskyi]|uniref:Uncharacterized protein n=1 Tax=Mycolicibacterium wolinskyi TaxID=59750 RepID=A0A1X2FAT8_9MYCO|nr:hypothetical protein AWC31_23010 [Mycolicibacterium wolinskyi]
MEPLPELESMPSVESDLASVCLDDVDERRGPCLPVVESLCVLGEPVRAGPFPRLSADADSELFDAVVPVSAQAVPCPAKIAAPTPSATARPPTRPTYLDAPT